MVAVRRGLVPGDLDVPVFGASGYCQAGRRPVGVHGWYLHRSVVVVFPSACSDMGVFAINLPSFVVNIRITPILLDFLATDNYQTPLFSGALALFWEGYMLCQETAKRAP